MRLYTTLISELVGKYFEFKDIKGIAYFCKLLSYTKVLNCLLFGEKYETEYKKKYNNLFRNYLIADYYKDHNKSYKILKILFNETEKDFKFVTEVNKKIDDFLEEKGIDYSFIAGKWKPLVVGYEVV